MTSIVDYFVQNPSHLFYTITGVCLLLELSILGMSGPLLFLALGSLLTGMLISLDAINGWEMAILSLGLLTAVSALLLWKPLKHFQDSSVAANNSSDMIGRVLPVTHPVTLEQGSVAYSGIEWQVRLRESGEPIEVGKRARVVAVDGSLLLVQAE